MPWDDFDLGDEFEDSDFSEAVLELELTASGWLWCTADGEELSLPEMDTRHVFNTAKMFFNHLAEAHGGIPVWFNQTYPGPAIASVTLTEKCAAIVVFLLDEVERRGDLPAKYHEPYNAILAQISPVTLPGGRRMLTAGTQV